MKKCLKITIILIILILLLNFIVNAKQGIFSNEYSINFIGNMPSLGQVIWISQDQVLFSSEDQVYIYTFSKMSTELVGKKKQNEIVGIDNNRQLIYCEYTIYTRYTEEDFAMTIRIYDYNHNFLKEKKLYDSFLPQNTDGRYVTGVTILPFLIPYKYTVDMDSGDVQKEEYTEDKDLVNIYQKPESLELPENIFIQKAYCFDEHRCILEDKYKSLFAYNLKQDRISEFLQNISEKSHEFFLRYFPM